MYSIIIFSLFEEVYVTSKNKEHTMKLSPTVCRVAMACCLLGAAMLQAQQGPAPNGIGIPYPKAQPGHPKPMAAFDSLQCAAIPTAVTASMNKYYYLTTDIAGKLGINWIGSVNASAESQQVVLIREMRRYAQCATTDGSGQLQYGAALRATV